MYPQFIAVIVIMALIFMIYVAMMPAKQPIKDDEKEGYYGYYRRGYSPYYGGYGSYAAPYYRYGPRRYGRRRRGRYFW